MNYNIPEKIDFYGFFRYIIPGYFGMLMFFLSFYSFYKIINLNLNLIIFIGLCFSVLLGITNRVIASIEFPIPSLKQTKEFLLKGKFSGILEEISVIIRFLIVSIISILMGNWNFIHLIRLQKLIKGYIEKYFGEKESNKALYSEYSNVWKLCEMYKYWEDKEVPKLHSITHSYTDYYWFFNNTTSGLFLAFLAEIFFIYTHQDILYQVNLNIVILTIWFYVVGNILSYLSIFNIDRADISILEDSDNKDSLRYYFI